jgi:lysophospholipase
LNSMAETLDLPPGGIAWDETLALEASDGVRLRGAVWHGGQAGGGSRGLVLLLSGRTEFLEKCATPAAELVARGFSVASVDWRGQGLSQRLVDPALKGHVDAFTDFHFDLVALTAHPSVAGIAGPRVVLAHSMGGAIALGAIVRGQIAPDAVILSAPMLGIAMPWLMQPVSAATLWIARRLGKMAAWPPFGTVNQPYVFTGFDGNILTGDRAMFDWMVAALRWNPALQLSHPTLGWLDAAFSEMTWLAQQGRLECPAQCLLGSREAVVDPLAVRTGASRIGAELVEIAEARHEVLIEAEPMRGQAWAAIDQFLERNGF